MNESSDGENDGFIAFADDRTNCVEICGQLGGCEQIRYTGEDYNSVKRSNYTKIREKRVVHRHHDTKHVWRMIR